LCVAFGAGCGTVSKPVSAVRTTVGTTVKIGKGTVRVASTTTEFATKTTVSAVRVGAKAVDAAVTVVELPFVLVESGPAGVARKIAWKSGLRPSDALLAAGLAADPRLQGLQILRGSQLIGVNPLNRLAEPPLMPGDVLKLVQLRP